LSADNTESDVGAGVGGTVAGSKEVTGIVPSDFVGVAVQPIATRNNISTRETQTVLTDKVDMDIFVAPCFNI
jgi:hypothetical protein